MSSYNTNLSDENKLKDSAIRALFCVTLLIVVMLFLAASYNNGTDPDPEKFAIFMCGVLLGSIYVFLGLVEVFLMTRLFNLKSSLLLWAFFVACLGYVAKAKASVDINTIFHMDASAFPMTLIAATFLHMINFLFLFFVVSGLGCLGLAMILVAQGLHRGKGFMLISCHVVTGLAFIVIALFAHFKTGKDSQRFQMIYRISHSVDFNAHSPCANIDSSTTNMVFLDADKRFALVAPTLDDFAGFEWRKVPYLRSVPIPENFKTVTCEYSISSENPTSVGGNERHP
ncbi:MULTISPECIES: hypothetical protein [Pseudomonas]|uniref:Uncharacterized protein n=1 Tax=Pseudomonas monteilii TaxID=76759 RepID=A0A399M6F5_9PSED|nr:MULTISPECIES: hypothetical protein [Pseudomonas]MCO7055690.1 hypothetical protein [Pseudomonas juntendi]RII77358.1 hypothetical protein D0894_12155 [Pseudomonas monteilii]UJM14985.1 hypothetical protein L1P09_12830 [Pseudomonas juntendi]UXA41138.1 hypothetical protein KZA81_12610 [Pseudomonas juntendi]